MSLKLGGSKSKTKTQSQSHEQTQSQGWQQQQSQDWGVSRSRSENSANAQSNGTRTAIVPEWASSLTQGVASRVGGLNALDPQSLVAPAHSLQTQAAARAGDLSGGYWNFNQAADVARGIARSGEPDDGPNTPTVRGESLLDNLSAYMSPYTRDVVDSTLADFDVDAGRTRAQQDLELAGAGAFGGSGAALTKSMTEGELSRARANAAATLRDQAFQRGAALSSEDAARRQQAQALNAQLAQQDWSLRNDARLASQDQRLRAAQSLANLSTLQDQNTRENIATQAQLGGVLREIEQEQRQAPITSAQQVVAMLSGLPIQLFTGEQTANSQTSQQMSDTMNAEAKGSSSSGSNSSSSVTDGKSSGTQTTKQSNFDVSLDKFSDIGGFFK